MARRMLRWHLLSFLLLACLTAPGSAVESKKPDGNKPDAKKTDAKADEEYYELFKSLADTIDQVEHNYVKDIDRRELFEAAIKGVLGKLDPYSSYIGRDEFDGFKNSVDSQFGGIGIQITVDRGQLKILSPLVGTPAYNAGLMAGDRIVKIGDEPTGEISLDDAVRRLKGEVGTSITLTVVHPDSTRQETVTVKRETIHVETVLGDRRGEDDRWDYMLDPDNHLGYIRITAFSRDTAADMKKALENLQGRKLRGLILDLRFNPGGLLTSAIEISDLFVSDGVIVSAEGRNSPRRVWEAHQEGTFEGFPIVVLVNRYSASASEIVSACLQDHKRAVVVGERTWGKGSVQNVIELEDGHSALKLTTASYQRPNGHNIHRFPDSKESDEWGVKPNEGYDVRLTESDMSKLVVYRRERDILLSKRAPKEKTTEVLAKAEPAAASETGDLGAKPVDVDAKPGSDAAAKKSVVPAAERPATETPVVEAAALDQAAKSRRGEFVDRQLQRAVEYLTTELARAQ